MGNVLVVTILILIIGAAVYGTVKRIRFGSSCCGERDPGEKKIRVRDRNRSHYPYEYILSVDGMHCSNCARRIENAFNKEGGRWATADIGRKEVRLLSKHEETESELSDITSSAGYTMLKMNKLRRI